MNNSINRLIRRPEVRHITGLSNSALDREMRAGRFPKSIPLSADPRSRAVGWSLHAVQSWIEERENAAA